MGSAGRRLEGVLELGGGVGGDRDFVLGRLSKVSVGLVSLLISIRNSEVAGWLAGCVCVCVRGRETDRHGREEKGWEAGPLL